MAALHCSHETRDVNLENNFENSPFLFSYLGVQVSYPSIYLANECWTKFNCWQVEIKIS